MVEAGEAFLERIDDVQLLDGECLGGSLRSVHFCDVVPQTSSSSIRWKASVSA